jgi:ribosomal protein L24E
MGATRLNAPVRSMVPTPDGLGYWLVAGDGGIFAFTANMHTDTATSAGSDAIIAAAKARGVPVISAKQLLTWLDARTSSSFGNVAWSNNGLTFNLTAGSGSNGLQALVPMRSALGPLTNLTKNGAAVAYTVQTLKGIEYAAFAASGGAWRANYRDDTPVVTTTTTAPTTTSSTVPSVVLGAVARSGYWMVGTDGIVYPFGDAKDLGNPSALLGGVPAMDIEPTPSLNGYWVVDSAGRVFSYGDAVSRGNANRAALVSGETITSLSRTKSGNGYWLFTTRGRAIPFGDATFLGDMSTVKLNGPVQGSVATPTGLGYYMVASDGGIFSFGDAAFHGSMGATRLNAPVRSMVPTPDGLGYWLVAGDGGIFAFTAPFRGSMGSTPLNKPVVGMVANGNGYLMVAADGGIFNFSDKPFAGSLGNNPPTHPITAVATLN